MAWKEEVTPEMEKDFKRSKITEMAPDFWRLEGYTGHPFSTRKSAPNVYIIRDEDTLILYDSGLYSFFRKRILEKLKEFERRGLKHLVLLNSHGHFDHVANNDLILETGFPEVRFLLPEPEFAVIALAAHKGSDLKALEEFYDPYSFEPWIFSPNIYEGIVTLAERAEALELKKKDKFTFDDVELEGWKVGRFLTIHDAGQSPGHICLYDPKNKIMLLGDLTLEINPSHMDSSIENSIKMLRRFRFMAEKGHINIVADSHRSSTFLPPIYEGLDLKPLHELQFMDTVKGPAKCIAYLSGWEEYFTQLKKEVIAAHTRIGRGTVLEIVYELNKSANPSVLFKKAIAYPNRPSRTGVLVARVLKEIGAIGHREGDKIFFAALKSLS